MGLYFVTCLDTKHITSHDTWCPHSCMTAQKVPYPTPLCPQILVGALEPDIWSGSTVFATHPAGLTLVLLNKLRCHAYFQFSANQITWSSLLIQIHILNDKQCRSRSVGFFRSQLIWIYTVCKDRVYPGSEGQGLRLKQLKTQHTSMVRSKGVWILILFIWKKKKKKKKKTPYVEVLLLTCVETLINIPLADPTTWKEKLQHI